MFDTFCLSQIYAAFCELVCSVYILSVVLAVPGQAVGATRRIEIFNCCITLTAAR